MIIRTRDDIKLTFATLEIFLLNFDEDSEIYFIFPTKLL